MPLQGYLYWVLSALAAASQSDVSSSQVTRGCGFGKLAQGRLETLYTPHPSNHISYSFRHLHLRSLELSLNSTRKLSACAQLAIFGNISYYYHCTFARQTLAYVHGHIPTTVRFRHGWYYFLTLDLPPSSFFIIIIDSIPKQPSLLVLSLVSICWPTPNIQMSG